MSWPTSVNVKVCGCRPHEGGAARAGAGVRKPSMEETAGGVERPRVRRYGDLTAVVPDCEHNLCDMARTLRTGENAFRRLQSHRFGYSIRDADVVSLRSLRSQRRRR